MFQRGAKSLHIAFATSFNKRASKLKYSLVNRSLCHPSAIISGSGGSHLAAYCVLLGVKTAPTTSWSTAYEHYPIKGVIVRAVTAPIGLVTYFIVCGRVETLCQLVEMNYVAPYIIHSLNTLRMY